LCETKEIVLNGLNVNITRAHYTPEEGKSTIATETERSSSQLEAKDIFADKKIETIQIEFPSELKPGFGLLSLEYEAEITENMKGLYRTQISTGEDDKPRYNFVTHFEPVNARRCFPCWDEPSFKATFDVTLIVPKDLVAIANMVRA
jgi:puromycin-sensitive aminopeptidase